MKNRVPNGICWPLSFGWRVSEQYRPPVRLASQVIRYEQTVMRNPHLDVPDFLLDELDRLEIGPYDICWLCLTRRAAQDFAGYDEGPPYRVETGDNAIILCEDGDDGYLIFYDGTRLQPDVLDRFKHYRSHHESALDRQYPHKSQGEPRLGGDCDVARHRGQTNLQRLADHGPPMG